MRNPYNIASTIMTDYADRIMYGAEAEDEALQNAIDWTLREQSDEFRADMYARIFMGWDIIELRFMRIEHVVKDMLHV